MQTQIKEKVRELLSSKDYSGLSNILSKYKEDLEKIIEYNTLYILKKDFPVEELEEILEMLSNHKDLPESIIKIKNDLEKILDEYKSKNIQYCKVYL